MKKFFYLLATDQINTWPAAIVKLFLWVVSFVYWALVSLRSVFYATGLFKVYKLPVKVISIGNITLGGVGKTPLVEMLARTLAKRNVKPAVLMRGYMGQAGIQSDEAQMLENVLSDVDILTGADRLKGAQEYLRNHQVSTFILDDGFQHRRLHRDLDIVVIDATNPWGNGELLPRGILREPLGALKRADLIILSKVDLAKESVEGICAVLGSINPDVPIVQMSHEPLSFVDLKVGVNHPLDKIKGMNVCLSSSIGDPDSFEQTLRGLGACVSKHFAFMDHHNYSRTDIERIIEYSRTQGIATIVTTDKDVVKWRAFIDNLPEDIKVVSLKMNMSFVEGEERFIERVVSVL